MDTCTKKASPRIRFIQYFICDALRKMFCPKFKALYRVFDKILKRWQKLWSRRRTGKNILGNLHALNWKREFLERIRLGACLLEKFWNLGLLECISSIPVQKLECFWVAGGWGARLEIISREPRAKKQLWVQIFRGVKEPRNLLEILSNTYRYNIFETYLGCWGC